MKFGIVSRETEGLFRYQGWPTVCMDERGRSYVVSSSNRIGHICPFGKDYMYTSEDFGDTWSKPSIVNDTALDDRDAGILSMGKGKMLLSWFNHEKEFYMRLKPTNLADSPYVNNKDLTDSMLDIWRMMPDDLNRCGSFIRLSNDYGKTWGEAIKVPVTSPHGPIMLKDGRLLYVGKEFHSNLNGIETGGIYVCDSIDGGKKWKFVSQIGYADGCTEANYHEPHALELPSGRIIVAIRVQNLLTYPDFTVHITYSDDGGRTWTKPAPTGVLGSPPHLMLHSSGAIIMTFGRRAVPFGERAVISLDGGKTFGKETAISPVSDTSDLGYPSSVELPDGTILTVYYQRYDTDKYASILYTKWRINEMK